MSVLECPTQQSFIWKEVTSYKIGILVVFWVWTNETRCKLALKKFIVQNSTDKIFTKLKNLPNFYHIGLIVPKLTNSKWWIVWKSNLKWNQMSLFVVSCVKLLIFSPTVHCHRVSLKAMNFKIVVGTILT